MYLGLALLCIMCNLLETSMWILFNSYIRIHNNKFPNGYLINYFFNFLKFAEIIFVISGRIILVKNKG